MVFGKNRADVLGGAIEVIGGDFDEKCDARGAIAFIGDFVNGDAAEFAGAFFDGPINVLARHRDGLGVIDGGAQASIEHGVSAAGACCDGNLVGAFREHTTFDGIDACFDVLDLGPFVMTGHEVSENN